MTDNQHYTLVTYKRIDLLHTDASKYGTLRIEGVADDDYIRNAVRKRHGSAPISVRRMKGDKAVEVFTLG